VKSQINTFAGKKHTMQKNLIHYFRTLFSFLLLQILKSQINTFAGKDIPCKKSHILLSYIVVFSTPPNPKIPNKCIAGKDIKLKKG